VKKVILPMSAIAAFALSAPSFAAQNNNAMSTTALSEQISQLSAETKKLEHEVWLLKNNNQHGGKPRVLFAHHKYEKTAETTVKKSRQKPWSHFVTVTTTPFMQKDTLYNGSDLLYNASSMNEDLLLLQQRKSLVNEMAKEGYKLDRPILQISGAVEGELMSSNGFGAATTSGVSLATGSLDFNAIASSWASAFMSLDYNGAPVSTGNRAPNSTIYLSRGFVTIGNLDKTPFYFTLGKMYIPFGRYENGMVSTPVTLSMGKTLTPAALLGVSLHDGLFASVYGYSGAQTSGSGGDLFKQAGVNAGFKHAFANDDNYSVGAGWVSNLADSEGMQNNGLNSATQFSGFAATPNSTTPTGNNLAHRVDAIDAHGQVTFGSVSFVGEYLGALEKFATTDMTFNNVGATAVGAEPQAMHAEIDYLLPFFAKKYGTTLGVSYGHTWQALALNLPENKYAVFLNTSIWRETVESIEYNHGTDYGTNQTATGSGAGTAIVGTGKDSNAVLAEVGVYF